MDYGFKGVHILSELYGIDPGVLDDVGRLQAVLERGALRSGAVVCGVVTKRFEPCGVSIVLLLSESHTSVHTYPEHGALFFDAFTCGDQCQPEAILEELCAFVAPGAKKTQRIERQ